jgi:hypothetical protein
VAAPLISLHIPKTGGTTFQTWLAVWAGDGLFLDYADQPLAPGYALRRLARLPADLARLRRVRRALAARPSRPVAIHGHFLGRKYRAAFPDAPRAAWFREPLERLVSHYQYWQRQPGSGNPLRRQMVAQRLGLLEFARLPALRNVHRRFLDGLAPADLAVLGWTGEFERSLALFEAVLGAGPQGAARNPSNQNPERAPAGYELDAATRAALADLNRPDLELYDNARRCFDDLCRAYHV